MKVTLRPPEGAQFRSFTLAESGDLLPYTVNENGAATVDLGLVDSLAMVAARYE